MAKSKQAPLQPDPRARRPQVGRQVRRWRVDRGLTLAGVSELAGLNVGYLSQIENDKASPSLEALGALAEALDVPIGWFLLADVPAPRVVRANERPASVAPGGSRMERVDGGLSRDISILQFEALPGARTGGHAHAGDEHHIILTGRWRMQQDEHELEVGPGDYVAWDATLPHDVELLGDERGSMLVISLQSGGRERTAR